jgi:hypothetical protein
MDTPINKGQLNIYDVAIFKNKPNLAYLYKKLEKLVSAIYLVSNFISDKEPLKWDMRETALSLINQGLSLSDRSILIGSLFKLISLFEVSLLAGFVSEMNQQILKFEIESLIQNLEASAHWTDSKGLVLPNSFFDVASLPMESKGHNIMSDRVSVKNRSDTILSLLKKNKELGIKDFVSAISDCSEKTIQRELASLVLKGVVKKEGEKRWSRYSLK